MPTAHTTRSDKTLLLALALTAVGGATGIQHAAAAPKLTCTFIHKQCMNECVKQAGRGFCQFHCDGEKRSCITTGRWSSFGRTFEKVERR